MVDPKSCPADCAATKFPQRSYGSSKECAIRTWGYWLASEIADLSSFKLEFKGF